MRGYRFSGSFGGALRPGKWQGNNLSARLRTGHPELVPPVLGLTNGNATDRIVNHAVSVIRKLV